MHNIFLCRLNSRRLSMIHFPLWTIGFEIIVVEEFFTESNCDKTDYFLDAVTSAISPMRGFLSL